MLNQRVLGGLYLALAASIWGGMYVVSKVILQFIPPLQLVWLRYVVAFVALFGMGLMRNQTWRLSKRHLPLIALIGLIGYVVSIYTQFLGTKFSSAQMGSIITAATPAFMVIFGRWLLHETITWRKIISVALATVGVLLIIGIGDIGPSAQLGGWVLLMAAITWALMSVLVKKLPQQQSQLVVTTYAIGVAIVFLTPMTMGHMQATWQALTHPLVWGGVLYLGVVSTAGAFFLWNKGLQKVDAASGGLYFFFQPLVGTLLGWVLLGEQVGLPFWLGAALILVGVVMVIRD